MKRVSIIALALLLSCFVVFAQNTTVEVNPLALLGGSIGAEVELKMQEKGSLVLSPSVTFLSVGVMGESVSYFGVSAGVGYNFYFTQALKGGYLGPFANVGYASSGGTSAVMFGGGLGVGYQWLLGESFVIDLGAGAAYFAATVADVGVGGILPFLKLGLGLAF